MNFEIFYISFLVHQILLSKLMCICETIYRERNIYMNIFRKWTIGLYISSRSRPRKTQDRRCQHLVLFPKQAASAQPELAARARPPWRVLLGTARLSSPGEEGPAHERGEEGSHGEENGEKKREKKKEEGYFSQ